jgi:hypothetical protein
MTNARVIARSVATRQSIGASLQSPTRSVNAFHTVHAAELETWLSTITIMMKVCATCGATVERTQCHKNRFGEYICRACQGAGIRSSWFRRWRHVTKKTVRRAVYGVGGVGLLVLLVWMFFNFLARMDS